MRPRASASSSAAADAFLEDWYDDVTIAAIAKRAGVSGQTVINHFGSKEQLATAAYEHLGQEITLRRYEPEPGDVAARWRCSSRTTRSRATP